METTALYHHILEKIILPINDSVKGTQIIKRLYELENTQWLAPAQIETIQNRKLTALLKHAYENVPYYQSIFKDRGLQPGDIRTKEDLAKLPVLTKALVRKNMAQLIARNYRRKDLLYEGTSGSTGAPLQVYKCKNTKSYALAALYRYYGWLGYGFGDRILELWGRPFIETRGRHLVKGIGNSLLRINELNAFQLSDEKIEQYVTIARNFKPRLIRGYSSAIYLLAKTARALGVRDIKPRAVSTTAQMLFSHQRNLIEEQFQCKVFDQYGCGEVNSVACECDAHSGYHIMDEHVIVEILNESDEVAMNQFGEITLTDLDNYGMPLIRYKNGDSGISSNKLCACGRGLSMLSSIKGRTQDLIITPSKKLFTVEFFVVFFEYMEGVDKFQIIQNAPGNLTVKIVKNDRFNVREAQFIKEKLPEHLGEDIKITLEFIEDIPTEQSGKYRFVKSKISNE